MYFLEPPGPSCDVRITPLSAREAFFEIVKFAFLMDVDDPDALKAEFESIARAASLPLFRRLSFPRDLARLPEVRREILLDLQTQPNG